MYHSYLRCTLAAIFGLTILSWAATRTTSFVHPEYDFGQVERVAIVPFENLSAEQGIGGYVTRVFLTELLATGAFDIIEPGEVTRVIGPSGLGRPAELPLEQIRKSGQELGAQVLIFGTIGESTEVRNASGVNAHIISISVRMVDIETGTTVWSAAVTTGGPNFVSRLLGTGDQSRGTSVRKAVRKSIRTLVK